MAVPAKRGVYRTITLQDGSILQVELRGDEHMHYFEAADGRVFQQVENSFKQIDRLQLKTEHQQRLQARNNLRVNKASRISYKGKRRGLVIMVNFQDISFTYSRDDIDSLFNQRGFNQCGMAGSVHDYFYNQSYGLFDLEFDVVGPVTVSKKASYYAAVNTRVPEMVYEACKKVDSQVNYKQYDWDDDGYVDQVYVMFAGYCAAQGAPNTIWPHEWSLYAGKDGLYRSSDGVRVETYGTSCELSGNGIDDTGILNGIGTPCHEFSHCMGIPDFYDTSEDGNNFGMCAWSLMDYGCYNDDGYTPCGYTAYERWVSGWLEPIVLDSGQDIVDMPAIQDEPVAYIIYNDATRYEYYMLENYQRKGFDKAGYGHGMLVLHVDYNKSVWENNAINIDTLHQRMTIIAADNYYTSRTLASDPFPGTRRKTSLTDSTTPAATLYNVNADGRKYMGKPITGIKESNGLISFAFMGGSVTPSAVLPVTFTPNKNRADLIFDVVGRTVSRPVKGLYIHNGRKYFVR